MSSIIFYDRFCHIAVVLSEVDEDTALELVRALETN
jgi:hypothetical protein